MNSGCTYSPMKRKGKGSKGRVVQLDTNFFMIKVNRKLKIFQYDITIEALSDKSGRKRNQRNENEELSWIDIAPTAFVGFNRAVLGSWCDERDIKLAYDGRKIAYSPTSLPNEHLCVEGRNTMFRIAVNKDGPVENDDSEDDKNIETIRLKIAHSKTMDTRTVFDPKNATNIEAGPGLAAIDAVLACKPLREYVQVGRSFYRESGSFDLPDGAQAWRGFYQSARLSQRGLVANIDESFTPFWGSGGSPLRTLMDKMRIILDPANPRETERASKLLRGLKVKARHSNITYRICGFSDRGPDNIEFYDERSNQRLTITQYFKQKYSVKLNDRSSPCVITNLQKRTMIPIEVLFVSSRQRLNNAMTPAQTRSMISHAAVSPNDRLRNTIRTVATTDHDSDPTCAAFNLKVSKRNLEVSARILDPPRIQYASSQDTPRSGSWNTRHNHRFSNAAPLKSWAVMNLSRSPENRIQQFIDALVKKARPMGMDCSLTYPPIYHCHIKDAERTLRSIREQFHTGKVRMSPFPLQLVLVICPWPNTQVYGSIKLVGDTELGVATQVMLEKNLNLKDATIGNLILKINAKLGGWSWVPATFQYQNCGNLFDGSTIVLGADVTHPAGGGDRPSVAALVCSRDGRFAQFMGTIRNQPPKQELMTDMYDMFCEVYDQWLLKSKIGNAKSIIMFRDGVSEGQFQQVLDSELTAIQRACVGRYKFNPKLTYIVVTKRHHARFFPKQSQTFNKNILPGTVIDTDVVSSNYYDFYLNSHVGIKGTSRPSKYTVLHDENSMPPDFLQNFIFWLTHNYVRCKRSVSIVNSVYYAHLLAFRGRAYLNQDDSEDGQAEAGVPATSQIHATLRDRLFFV